MSYRKLELNGRIYEWVVGKSVLKVKGVGIWPIADVGTLAASKRDWSKPYVATYVCGPAHVINAILGKPKPVYECDRHPGVGGDFLAADPFASEIYDKIMHVPNCPDCLQESAWDI